MLGKFYCRRTPHPATRKRAYNSLSYEVMKGSMHLYTIDLMEVYEHECVGGFTSGRFERYTDAPLEHGVTIPLNAGRDDLLCKMQEMVEWIAEQSTGAWTFDPIAHSVGRLDVVFGFEDPTSAVVFKLTFG